LTHSALAIALISSRRRDKKNMHSETWADTWKVPPSPLYGGKRNSRIKYEPIKVKVFLEF